MFLIKFFFYRRNSTEENLIQRFREMGDDGEESSKPLLADSEGMTAILMTLFYIFF